MRRKTETKNIKVLNDKKLIFLKALKDNPDLDEPIPDDVLIPEDLIYDDYTNPWISINYYNSRIDINEEVIIPFYCTDYYQCEYRYDIYKEFKVRYELDGVVNYKTIKAGDNEINFGKLSEGIHYYTYSL